MNSTLRPRRTAGPSARTLGRIRTRMGRKMNRAPSPVLARGVPWLSVALASMVPTWLVIASAPVLPPLGLLMLLAWRQLRPGVLPVWAGLPLGLFDDLFSGQPLGSAVLMWSAAMIILDLIEARVPWRNFVIEWAVAAAIIAVTLALGLVLANAAGARTPMLVIAPQLLISIFAYPLVARLVALLDHFRLVRIVELR
jgi:rod shape-determining protein MreD